ncbi:MAG: hypothetical protein ACTMUB_02840 [cyanobacterium endosymbiont of Rhopalodia musculus]|nr:hypothetical protein [cyanobacterium endosymbiont of Epithemia clementina EcSB]WGT67155.1 hypothetical protein P3F56_08005 [cyanobacterium endosymbiont of Epithemia clementina EcSB]
MIVLPPCSLFFVALLQQGKVSHVCDEHHSSVNSTLQLAYQGIES